VHSKDLDPFVGRGDELSILRTFLMKARSGKPQTVLIHGPAGIGKTSLIEHFFTTEQDLFVLRASGEKWEALVPFGVIDQLMRGAGAGRISVLASRARALPPEEPVTVGTLLLETLEKLQQKQTVVLVVDDAHWADVDSLRALLFALRRLATGRVLTLLTARDEEATRLLEGLQRLATGPAGRSLSLPSLDTTEVHQLGLALGVPGFSAPAAAKLTAHTKGNPLYARALLAEVPADRWGGWRPALPAPRAFAAQVLDRLSACSAPTRSLLEAASVLGVRSALPTAAALGEVVDPVGALEEAVAAELLKGPDQESIWEVMFPHPLVQAAVYEHVGPSRRLRLHRAAAHLVEDDGAALRHRVAATEPPDETLAEDLDAFARRESRRGAWASAAAASVEASRLSKDRQHREQRLLRAIDAIVSAGDLVQGSFFARDAAQFEAGPLRDSTLGYLAILQGRAAEAEALLQAAWTRCDPVSNPAVAAVIALRWTLHSLGRLNGADILDLTSRTIALAPGDESVRLEAEALRGLGFGLTGRVPDGLAAYAKVLSGMTGHDGVIAERTRMAQGWLQVVNDEFYGVPRTLSDIARSQLQGGAVRIAVWCYVWLARAHYLIGAWDEATRAAQSAVSLLEETGHEWLRPAARWVAVGVPANRGEYSTAAEHARLAAASRGEYELMIVTAALTNAEYASAVDDHEAVLHALEPLLEIQPRDGVDEPGFWPWQHLYAEALLNVGRLTEADKFLRPHEDLAAARKRRSSIARLARVRGQLEAAAGRIDEADAVFRFGLEQLNGLSLTFDRAQLELAYGRLLRRRGQRRSAATYLQAARGRFAALDATPHIERCDMEMTGSGLSRPSKQSFDPVRLTARELAVAQRAAAGKSNQDIASEMLISVKTVQFHIGNIYAKLGVRSRVQLAGQVSTLPERTEVPKPRSGT
jgi:DNA-binding CsgD family transcriptional regulator